jgi:pyrroloquinoline quinone (PQQ) biosynthesis protein C
MDTTAIETVNPLRTLHAPREDVDASMGIARLRSEALAHRAVSHPYLHALAHGELPAPAAAVLDLTYQYHAYSSWFQRYLTAVISQLDEPAHRAMILHNLSEECGALDEDERAALEQAGIPLQWVDGVPHGALYERFLRASGLRRHAEPLCDEVLVWRTQLLQACSHAGARVAVGALGLGTELIVSQLYRPILQAIQRFLDIAPRDRVFFDLHCSVDDEHGEVLERLAVELVRSPRELEEVRLGMLTALTLRSAFFDAMWRRAQGMVAERGLS